VNSKDTVTAEKEGEETEQNDAPAAPYRQSCHLLAASIKRCIESSARDDRHVIRRKRGGE
jgi:hypothetical protein